MSNNVVCCTLEITLLSDLCVASGDGYSSGIDVDICNDEHGLPLIPARRLKGCLREAALDVLTREEQGERVYRDAYAGLEEGFNALFGLPGESIGGSLRVQNAVLANAAGVSSVASENRERFTYTRAQTAINEEGSADENTLRFIRVVKQYDPVTGEKLMFTAQVQCERGQFEILSIACRALRNIGYGRNRGFGAIQCKLSESANETAAVQVDGVGTELQSNVSVRLSYSVRLDSQLMIPLQNSTESGGYVPGTSVLGFFASKLRSHIDFDRLFLSGDVRFSPLYPVDAMGNRCLPAPPFVVKIKGGKADGEYRTAWQVLEGETAKPLKGGFVGSDFHPVETDSVVSYHHSRQGDGVLYTQRCLKPGQVFSGYIDGDGESVMALAEVLRDAPAGGISFGRSKTAQYSSCTLIKARITPLKKNRMSLSAGKRYAFVLDSDALLVEEEHGRIAAGQKPLVEALQRALSAQGCTSAVCEGGFESLGSNLRYRTVMGYNSKWNQKKPHVLALAAGSSLTFVARANTELPVELMIGERLQEGFGRVVLVDLAEVEPTNKLDAAIDGARQGLEQGAGLASWESKLSEDQRLLVIGIAKKNSWRFVGNKLNLSFIGRITRMAKEAADDPDFRERVASIKARAKREDVEALLRAMLGELGAVEWEQEQEALVLMFTMGKYLAKQEAQAISSDERGQ